MFLQFFQTRAAPAPLPSGDSCVKICVPRGSLPRGTHKFIPRLNCDLLVFFARKRFKGERAVFVRDISALAVLLRKDDGAGI